MGSIHAQMPMVPEQHTQAPESPHLFDQGHPAMPFMMPVPDTTAPSAAAPAPGHTAVTHNTLDTTTPAQQAERSSTVNHNDALSLIKITAGQSHVLPVIVNKAPHVAGYFVQKEEYKSCLGFTQSSTGTTSTLTYTLTIPVDAGNDNFVIFKGQDSLTQPKNLEPVFRVEVLALPESSPALHKTSTREQIKQAWQQQQAAEQKYFNDAKERFEAFTKEVRTIWSAVKQDDSTKVFDDNIITKEPLHLTVGETTQLASSQGGSIQSTHPEIVTAKLTLEKSAEPVWNFLITGKKVGKSIILYSMDGINYAQTVIVQEQLLPGTQEVAHITEPVEESTTNTPQFPSQPIDMHDEEETAVAAPIEKLALPEPLVTDDVTNVVSPEAAASDPQNFFPEDNIADDDDEEEDDEDDEEAPLMPMPTAPLNNLTPDTTVQETSPENEMAEDGTFSNEDNK